MKNRLEDFYKGKKVFVTGHNGFKGAWISMVLNRLGAEVIGYSLKPQECSLFNLCCLNSEVKSYIGDIRDLSLLRNVMQENRPDIVIHMAAQPIVLESYNNPVYTYETNVMGTVNILEAIRNVDSVKSVINVTTDKVYFNDDRKRDDGFKENEKLDGYDPYSNSKSCSELVTSCYKKSFFSDMDIAISTCRAGNVIGGGDFAENRIIPDCVRAAAVRESINVRNPHSIRPYQHVLEAVITYLLVAMCQYDKKELAGCYNIGPDEADCISTGRIVELFCKYMNANVEKPIEWINKSTNGIFHEASFLRLDNSKIKKLFGWKSKWNIEKAIEKTVEWTITYLNKGDMKECALRQIEEYIEL